MRDCSQAVPGVPIKGRPIVPVVSLTVMTHDGWNTQLTAGALTSTMVKDCAARGLETTAAAKAAINVANFDMRISPTCRLRRAAHKEFAHLHGTTQGCRGCVHERAQEAPLLTPVPSRRQLTRGSPAAVTTTRGVHK